jgi:thiol-disulfide isomerase/thioredoxin
MSKLTTKSFWLGLALGIGICVLIVSILVSLFSYYGKKTANDLRTQLENMPSMTFPTDSDSSVCNQADSSWVLHDLTGKRVTFSNFRGKVVFVDFWATWCGACTIEMPTILRLRQRVKDLPVEFVFVTNEDRRRVQKFLKKNALSLPVYLAETSPPSAFTTSSLPTSFIINRDGVIVYRHIGVGKWDDSAPEQFLRALSRPSVTSAAKPE